MMIKLDGSDGGGQMVRTALALSTYLGKPFQISNIRQKRPNPGLKSQHLAAISALRQICGAKTNDIDQGTTLLRYIPGKVKNGRFNIDIGTAGSVTLVLQALLLPCLERNITLSITGGTCGKWQPPCEYFQNVFLPLIHTNVQFSLMKRGYYPKGGGIVTLKMRRGVLPDLCYIQRGDLVQVKILAHASSDLTGVAERVAESARLELASLNVPVNVSCEYQETLSPGAGITIWARYNQNDEFNTLLGSDKVGERGYRAQDLGRDAALSLLSEIRSGAVVDSFLADQILPFMAFKGGTIITSHVSDHVKSNLKVIESFLPIRYELTQTQVKISR